MGVGERLDADHRKVYEYIPEDFMDLTDIVAVRNRTKAAMAVAKRPPMPADVVLEDHQVPGWEGDPDVLVRLYRPAALAPGVGALYWMHAGGMVLGDVGMNDDSNAAIASALGVLVASVEYRLAPEHPYPAQVDDAYAGLVWLHANAATLGIDPDRIALGGASAGGGLAAGLALLARANRGVVRPVFQYLCYPMLDDRHLTPSSTSVTDLRVWNHAASLAAWEAYLGAGVPGGADVSIYAAPLRAEDLSGLPPAYIAVGDLDMFVDEDIAYAQALMRAHVPVELHVYPGCFHGSDTMVPRADQSRRWVVDTHAALARGLNVAPSAG